jgi:hypothetical protein
MYNSSPVLWLAAIPVLLNNVAASKLRELGGDNTLRLTFVVRCTSV